MAEFEIRDPIHTRIPFSSDERRVIDHPFFQRLRFISQLSLLQSYVYPGATHDRFAHGLGAMHIAGRLFGRMVASSSLLPDTFSGSELSELRRRIRLAGLLHDIGHGPFSHSSETLFPLLKDLPMDWGWWKEVPARQAKHEDYSVLLIQAMVHEGVLERQMAQDIASFVHEAIQPSEAFRTFTERLPGLHKLMKNLVSGEVDCDRMDYLLRDSHYCGVIYGKYDIDWLISSMGIAEKEGGLIFTISENGVRAFENVLLARYHMLDQVYFHKTKSGFHEYLERAFTEREIQLSIPTDPYEYASMRDGKVVELMFKAAEANPKSWSAKLVGRQPPKHIMRLHETELADQAILEKLIGTAEQHDIFHFVRKVRSNLSDFGELRKDDRLIYVSKKRPSGSAHVPIEEYSNLLQRYDEKIRIVDFFVLQEDHDRFKTAWNN